MNTRKIYFAGSIRGGRDDVETYMGIIEELQKFGEVLTEHVGDAGLKVLGEDGKTDTFIYDRDVDWLTQAELLVAEVTTPSLGVGYEIGKAEAMGKMILCLYRPSPGKQLSAMIAGNRYVQIATYQSRSDIQELLQGFFLD